MQIEGIGAPSGDFEKTTEAVRCWAGDGARSEEIADLKIAAVAGLMGDHLRRRPVQHPGGAAAEADAAAPAAAHLARLD